MRARFAAAILLLAFPLAADVISLGVEKPFDDFPHLVADSATLGRLIPNADGYFLLFVRGTIDATYHPTQTGPLWAMQLDHAGQPVTEWRMPLDANVTSLQTIGVHVANGSYLASWREEGADHDVLAVISADGHTIVRTNPLPPQSSLASLDCSADRCLGVMQTFAPPPDWWRYTHEIVAFSLLGETMAGPVSFGPPSLNASVVADGDNFKVAWSLWSDPPSPIHVLTVDRTAKIVSDEIVSQTGRFVTAARGTRPVYFFVDGDVDVKAVASGEAPKTVAHLADGAFAEDLSVDWNGSEFLVVTNAEPPGGWAVIECTSYPVQAHGIRVNAALDPIDAAAFPLTHVPIEATLYYSTVAASGGEFLAGGSEQKFACGPPTSYVTHVTPSGIVDPPDLGRPVALQGSSAYVAGAVSVAGTDAAVWHEGDVLRHLVIASRLGRDAQPIVVSNAIPSEATLVHGASDGHSLFVIDDACTAVDIIDGTAGAVSHRAIGCGAFILALTWSGSHYVAAARFSDSFGIIRFAADGTLLGTTIVMKGIVNDGGAGIAAAGSSSVVVWMSGGTTYAATVSDTGSILVSPHAIAPALVSMALTTDGTSALLIQKGSLLVTGYLLSSDSTVIDQAVLDTTADGTVDVGAGRANGRWIATWSNTIHAFATLHSGIATLTLPGPPLLLTRPDGSAAAVMAVWREKDGMRGQVVVEREIEITATKPRRRAL